MQLIIPDELRAICKQIIEENKTDMEWADSESDDEFQSASFVGGYDADEVAFCFSYYDAARCKFWFQLSIGEVRDIETGGTKTVEIYAVA